MRKMNFLFVCILIAYTLVACQKDVLTAPDVVYANSTLSTNAGTNGSFPAPTIDWHHSVGTFAITSVVVTQQYTGSTPVAAKLTLNNLGGGVKGLSINSSTGEVSWTGETPAGKYAIVVVASNVAGASNPDTLQLNNYGFTYGKTSTGSSTAPASPSITLNGLTTSSFVSKGSGDSIIAFYSLPSGTIGTYTFSGNPAGVKGNASTGTMSWSGSISKGTYTIQVSNTAFSNYTASYVFVVTDSVATMKYSKTSKTIVEGTATISETPTLSDTILSAGSTWVAPTYSISGVVATTLQSAARAFTSYEGISIDAQTGIVSFASTLKCGTYAVSIKNARVSASATYTLTVRNFKYPTTESKIITKGIAGSSEAASFFGEGSSGGYYINNIFITNSSGVTTTQTSVSGISIDAVTGVLSWASSLKEGKYVINIKNYASVPSAITIPYTLTVNP